MRNKKGTAADAANIGGSMMGTIMDDIIPKSYFIISFNYLQEKRGVSIG